MQTLPAPPNKLASNLVRWFRKASRDLPWRHNRTAYRVWLSEIMLQQTQVATVESYFKKFVLRFPKVSDLAKASQDEVLGMWAGLGYYSRARNLHKTAQIIHSELDGDFPLTQQELKKLPGIGPYTSGAIATLAYNLPSTMVDGNIARVLTRVAEEPTPINEKSGQKWLEANVYQLLSSHKSPREVGEGLMELGALICLPKNPQCTLCPFMKNCSAFNHGTINAHPQKLNKVKVKTLRQVALFIQTPRSLLLHKQPQKGLFAGLYTLPFLSLEEGQSLQSAQRLLAQSIGISPRDIQWSKTPVKRKLTHRNLIITCGQASFPKQTKIQGEWHSIKTLENLGISTAMVHVMCDVSPKLRQNFGVRAIKR